MLDNVVQTHTGYPEGPVNNRLVSKQRKITFTLFLQKQKSSEIVSDFKVTFVIVKESHSYPSHFKLSTRHHYDLWNGETNTS